MTDLHNLRQDIVVRRSARSRRTVRLSTCGVLLVFAAGLTASAQAPSQTISAPQKITADQLADAEAVFGTHELASNQLGIFLQAADQGSAAAKRDLGLVYQPNDAEKALQWFEAAAIAGDIRAFSYIGDFYLDPKNGKSNPKEAQYWYEKSYKARDARGTIALAMLSCNGIGVKKDLLACGKLLDSANSLRKKTDPKDVSLNLAADEVTLGIAYQSGKGVPRNLKTAASWYAKSAALGSVPGAVAQSKLYIEGGLPQNLPLAASILAAINSLANKTRDPYQDVYPGQDTVAATYVEIGAKYEARGPAGMAQAFPVYKSAAILGNGAPAVALAVRYANGNGVPKNLDTAYGMMMQLTGIDMHGGREELADALDNLAADYTAATGQQANPQRVTQLRQLAMRERIVVQAAEAGMQVPIAAQRMTERYPNLSAPDTVPVAQEFAVNVSLNAFQFDNKTQIISGQQDNGQLQISLPEGMTTMPIQVDLIAPGMTFTDGTNSATLTLDSTQPNSLPAVFHLRSGSAPASSMLIASLSYHQNAIAQLARPIVTVAATSDAPPVPQPPIVTLTPPAPITGPPSPATNDAATRSDNTPLNSSPLHPKNLTLSAPAPLPPNPHPTTNTSSPIPAPQPKTQPIVLDPNAKFADLTIHETVVDDTMYYTFDSPGLAGTVYATYPGVAGLKAKIQQLYSQLQVEGMKLGGGVGAACAADRAKGGGNDKDDNCQESVLARGLVQGIGNHLYQDLAPPEFRTIYQLLTSNHIRISSITVVTNSPTLPWELMLPQAGTDQFFGLTAAVVRENASAPQLAQPAEVDFTGLSVVAPNYSGALALDTAAEVKALKTDFPQLQQTDGDALSVSALIRNAPQGIVHFAGHGKRYVPPPTTDAAAPATTSAADTLAPQVAIALEDDDMTPDTFIAFRAEGKPAHPFYFLNACDLGQSDPELNYIDGWAPALMQSGASGYLGALFEVGDDSATHFATYFYAGLKKDLAANTNWSVADLVTSARKATYMEANDPTALAYVLYAKPFMKLVAEQ
jgi:TPR repeat protein